MPLFIDRHDIEGVTAQAVMEAHALDMAVQDKHGVNYLTYWVDEARGRVFCLCDAPTKELAEQVHREAHGLLANKIMEVDPDTVEAFLGTVEQAPSMVRVEAVAPEIPAPEVFGPEPGGSAFRAVLFTDMTGSTEMTRRLGDIGAMEVLRAHNVIIRDALRAHHGREIKHTGDGFMTSFISVSCAVECAIAILRAFEAHNREHPDHEIHVRIGLTAGEPVEEDNDLFGATVQMAARLCSHAQNDGILVSGVVQELCVGKKLEFVNPGERTLKGFDVPVRVYEVGWAGSA
jgi:class 3 adenylate cyclase